MHFGRKLCPCRADGQVGVRTRYAHCRIGYLAGNENFQLMVISKSTINDVCKVYNNDVLILLVFDQIMPKDIDGAVSAALENGYKHIDTAFVYENEDAIGKSLKKWFDKGGKREDIFITTKVFFCFVYFSVEYT